MFVTSPAFRCVPQGRGRAGAAVSTRLNTGRDLSRFCNVVAATLKRQEMCFGLLLFPGVAGNQRAARRRWPSGFAGEYWPSFELRMFQFEHELMLKLMGPKGRVRKGAKKIKQNPAL